MERPLLPLLASFVASSILGCSGPSTTMTHVHPPAIQSVPFTCESRRQPTLSPEAEEKLKNGQSCGGFYETRLIPIPDGISPEAVAMAFCHQIAGEKGRASVIGSVVLASDGPGGLDELELLIKNLDEMRKEGRAGTAVPALKR